MKEEKITFKLKDEEGNVVEHEVLFTFESEETKKNYVVYTDNKIDDKGNVKVYASTYEPNEKGEIDGTKTLKPIETEQEWKIIETILDELQSDTTEDNKE